MPPPRSLRASESSRLLSSHGSFQSEGSASTASAPSIIPQRWRRRFPIIQSTINLTRSGPLRVSLFAVVAFAFGLVVLVHTQNMELTANLPESAFHAAHASSPVDARPKFHADASNCSELYFEQRVDHFAWLPAAGANSSKAATYQQRYLINDQFWDPSNKRAPVFFYTGNEGDVTLYANHTGLMWENAEHFGALIVFAEHRYYGKSMPFGDEYMDHLAYLNHEQALADFTELIFFLQREHNAENHPVIAFGGSYGGMLSAWFRMKYPSIIHGAIAASAPIFGFPSFPEWKGDNYWQIVTRDALPETGSAKNCVPNAKKSWPKIFSLAKTEAGREKLSSIFRLCAPLEKAEDGENLAMLVLFGFDNLAMGNFPYPSSYLTGGAADLPAWPVREACSHLAGDFEDGVDDDKLLAALRDAGNVFNNATKDLTCLKLPSQEDFDGIWDFQWCTQMLPQETYFNTNGETDMFWVRNITMAQIEVHCQQTWATTPDPDWIRVSYGDTSLRFASNIVFSNGMLDPWSSGGVHHVPAGSKVTIVSIEEGAHHLDLFFSHPDDPVSVKKARATEVKEIHRWIDEYVAVNERAW
ncbi:Lysosomal pro-x carboxypeptidase [Globisporangium polare]